MRTQFLANISEGVSSGIAKNTNVINKGDKTTAIVFHVISHLFSVVFVFVVVVGCFVFDSL